MRTYLSNLAIFVLLLFIYGCCGKKDCVPSGDNYHLWLTHFDPNDLDSATLEKFAPNTNFAIKQGSISYKLKACPTCDSSIIVLSEPISYDNEYKITLTKTKEVFLFTSFQTKSILCEKCIFGDYKIEELDYYFVNGKRQVNSYLVIAK